VTALVIVRWKPSARSRSLRDISALSAPPARIRVAQATLLPSVAASPPHGSSLPVRQVARGATHASPFQSARGEVCEGQPPIIPRRDDLCNVFHPWRTERARADGGERSERSRLRGPYSRECGAVLLTEREYPAQRPPAARGLSSHDRDCGAVCGRRFSHSYRPETPVTFTHSVNVSTTCSVKQPWRRYSPRKSR